MSNEKLGLWLILDLFFRIITIFVVIPLIVMKDPWKTLMIIIFMIWAFRPIYLSFIDFKKDIKKRPNKKNKIDKKKWLQILNIIFWIMFSMGFILFINRAFIQILPISNWRVLLDHLVGGYLVTILFYILLLGLFSFFNPKRKIIYEIKWFVLASLVTFLCSFYWEGILNSFKDISQIVADYFGILISWTYFLVFRRLQNAK